MDQEVTSPNEPLVCCDWTGATGKNLSANQVHGAYDVKPARRGNNEHQYQKLWQHWQQHQQIVTPVAQQTAKVLISVFC